MNSAIKAGLVGIVLAGLVATGGCSKSDQTNNLAGEYAMGSAVNQNTETFSRLEGKILKVQPSQLSYVGGDDNRIYGSNISANHEFEYVAVKGLDGKMHTLIYPYSKSILEGNAVIKYRPLNSGRIDAETFIDTFLNKGYFTDDNFTIEAEGIITAGGIQYNQ